MNIPSWRAVLPLAAAAILAAPLAAPGGPPAATAKATAKAPAPTAPVAQDIQAEPPPFSEGIFP